MHSIAKRLEGGGYLIEALVIATIIVSMSSSSILVLLSTAEAEACAFWRSFIAGVITLAFKLSIGRNVGSVGRREYILSIASGFFLAIHLLLWMKSLFFIPVSISTTIVDTYPLITVLSDMLLGEKPSVIQLVGLILGFTGVTIFMQPWVLGGYNPYGVILAFLGAVTEAVYFTLGRIARRGMDILSYTAYTYTSSSMILLYGILIGSNIHIYSSITYVYFILLALIPMIGGHTLINYLLKYRRISIATSVTLCEPIGASIMASIIFNQYLDAYKILFMTVTMVSTAIVVFSERR